MKKLILALILITIFGCSKNKTFVLKDTDNQKYFLSDSIHKIIKLDQITSTPIVIIDGRPFEYDIDNDTIFIPLEKKDLYQIAFLNKQTATMLYGFPGERGAVIIMTKPNLINK
jgi:hypothetical protein